MNRADEQRRALLERTIDAAADRGLDDFSLRHLASLAGTSTTAIFQNFSGKAELLESALSLAIERDRVFHESLSAECASLLTTHVGFADFVACYIKLRPPLVHARFVSEILLRLEDYPQCRDLIGQWHALRTEFWARMLADLDAGPGLAELVAQFVLMEEFYAYALHGECTYGLLLAETCRALCDAAFHGGAAGGTQSNVSLKLDVQPMAMHGAGVPSDSAIPEQLLDEALRIIEESGFEAVNQRRIAKSIGVSASAIAYYFKDMKSFRNRAIWCALVNGIPSQLDPESPTAEQPRNLSQWLETLDAMLRPGAPGRPSGFYISFARLTGQACLLSLHDPSLTPLISYLRALEGWGTYHVSSSIPSLAELIGRDHATAFGMWIKAEALLRRVGLASDPSGIERLHFAARLVFPQRTPS